MHKTLFSFCNELKYVKVTPVIAYMSAICEVKSKVMLYIYFKRKRHPPSEV